MLFRYFDLPDSILHSSGAFVGVVIGSSEYEKSTPASPFPSRRGVISNAKWNNLGQTTVRLYPKALNYATCKYVPQSIQQSYNCSDANDSQYDAYNLC
jgi:hypothetical protein